MEIADAVLTLRTDDAPLRQGLDAAEARIRESLARMQQIIAATGVDLNAGGAAVVATAITALSQLSLSITAGGSAATLTGVQLSFLTTAMQTMGGAALLAASQLISAITRITAALAAMAAAARGRSANPQDSSAGPDDDDPPPPVPGDPFPPPSSQSAATAGRLRPGPFVGQLNITIDREHPRAIQAGVERALAELSQRADLAGALD